MQLQNQEVIGQIVSVITGDREIVRGDDDEPIGIRITPSNMRALPEGPIMQNVRGNNVGN